MKKPTLKQVREYFKDAETIHFDDFIYKDLPPCKFDLTTLKFHVKTNAFYCDSALDILESSDILMYCNNSNRFADIVKYKDNVKELSKYHVECKGLNIDVYDVLKAFDVVNPATQHAIKKLLKGGQRGFKDVNKDYQEAIDSIVRAIELNK
jgi:hypothetical protein